MRIGTLVHDYALGRNGVVVSGAWVEVTQTYDSNPVDRTINWEWCVLYDDGELQGADTSDLKEMM
jgi:hypothetical protein